MRYIIRFLPCVVILSFTFSNATAIPFNSVTASPFEVGNMKERIAQIKKSTVRVLVNSQASGTGFVVSPKGLIATCFHVVQLLQPAPNGQTLITYAPNIEVEFNDGTKLPATVHPSCQNQGLLEALSKDFTILQVQPARDLIPVTLGTFADAYEGANIYICGFPLGLDKPFISSGILSTKISTPGHLGQGTNRDAALLDITLNKGNSGGPVILFGKEPKDDKVIGIATFTLSPLSLPLAQIVQTAQQFPGTGFIMGVNFKEFSMLIKNAFESTSVGIGGCISVDYMRSKLK